MKHTGGNTAERCSPSKNNTGAALGQAAVVQASLPLESGKTVAGGLVHHTSRSPFQEPFRKWCVLADGRVWAFFFLFINL